MVMIIIIYINKNDNGKDIYDPVSNDDYDKKVLILIIIL